MADSSASAAATSTSGLNAPNSGNINFAQSSYGWIAWTVGGIVVLFALAVWAKKRKG